MTRMIAFFLAAAIGIAGCSGIRPDTLPPAEELGVREAVFQYQFEHNPSSLQGKASGFYLSVNDADPPPLLLERFASNTPRVFAASAYVATDKTMLGFTQGTITIVDATHVVVAGGYFEFELAAIIRYEVAKQGNTWVVTKAITEAIS